MAGVPHDRIDRASLVGVRSGGRIIIAVDLSERRWIKVTTRCDCGNEESTNYGLFRRRPTGCKFCRLKGINRTHGHSKESLFGIWRGILHRCGPSAGVTRRHYYDKGIRVCEEWRDYEAFRSWALANGYRAGLVLDRLSPSFDYAPANCEWVTQSENAKRVHRHRTFPMGEIVQFIPPRELLIALNPVT